MGEVRGRLFVPSPRGRSYAEINASWRIGTGAPCGGDRVEGKDELAETTGLRIESAWRNSHGSRQEAQRRQAQRSHIPIPTNRNRHADRRTQSLYPCGETIHNQDPLTNRGMGDHTIAAPCTKAIRHCLSRTIRAVPRFSFSKVTLATATAITRLAPGPASTGQPIRPAHRLRREDLFQERTSGRLNSFSPVPLRGNRATGRAAHEPVRDAHERVLGRPTAIAPSLSWLPREASEGQPSWRRLFHRYSRPLSRRSANTVDLVGQLMKSLVEAVSNETRRGYNRPVPGPPRLAWRGNS